MIADVGIGDAQIGDRRPIHGFLGAVVAADDLQAAAVIVVGDLLKVPARTIGVLQSMPAPAPKPAARRTRKAMAKDTTEGDSNP